MVEKNIKQEEKMKRDNRDFIAMAIHKLKTPISSIKLSLGMLLEGDFGELRDEQKKVLERTYQRNNSLIYLVDDLLNLARVKNKHSYNLKMVNFEDLIKEVIDCEQEQIKKKEAQVKFENAKTNLPKIKVDKDKMFLAIQNIFNNAVKYCKIGGEVIIYLQSDGKNLELKIKDDGIGISENEKSKLFTEFFRGENAKELDPMGSGLGLYIAKDIIEDHNGKIWFESKENKGTTFFVTLPIK